MPQAITCWGRGEARGAEKRAELIEKQAGLRTMADEIEEEASELLESCEHQVLGDDVAAARGFVWLYLRK